MIVRSAAPFSMTVDESTAASGQDGRGARLFDAPVSQGEREELEGAGPERGVSVLVVDDEPYILRSLSYLLTREGYVVETASNGGEGLERVRELRPRIVFLDIMMPDMDGYEVCEQIKRDPELEKAHVIMLSAKGQQNDLERALLAGARTRPGIGGTARSSESIW
ncbi:MAG: response regulator [Betaproteobacteria bacterium]|nr:response regulator [Betaproteobacteria bacterium]